MLLCKERRKEAESLPRKSSGHILVLLTWEEGKRTGIRAAVIHCSSGSNNSEELMHFSVLTTLVLQVMNYRPFSSYDTLSNCVSSN